MTTSEIFNPAPVLRSLSANRELLAQFVRRSVQARYRGSMFGIFWSFAQPLLTLCVYTFVFSYVLKARWTAGTGDNPAAFAIIMFAGMAVFNIFSESVAGSCSVIVSSPNYVKKVIFPLEILPAAQTLSAAVFGGIWFTLLLAGALLILQSAAWTMLLLPFVIAPLLLMSCGCAFFTASAGVYFRDLQHLIGVLLQMLFFMSPIIYPAAAVPERFRWIIMINPLSWIIEETRRVFLFGEMPHWDVLGGMYAAGIIVFQLGYVWFAKTRKGFADVI